MFFFFHFDDYKKVDERIEADGGKEAVDILKKRKEFLGINNSDVAALLDENKSGTSRYFKRNMKITAERTQRTARALGGTLRLEDQDSGNGHLVFSTETESFADLIMQFRDAVDQDERDHFTVCELPLAIINQVGIDSRDYIIKSSPKKRPKRLIETSGGELCWIKLINRFYTDIEFSVLIISDMNLISFMVGISNYSEDVDFKDIREYKQAIDIDEARLEQYTHIMRRFMTAETRAKTIYGNAVLLDSEKEILYSSLQTAFDKYSTLLSKLTGTVQARNTINKPVDANISVMPTEIREAVVEDRNVACEVDITHELFEGLDGKSYVEIIPFIPINDRTIQSYGEKLISKANAVMLCPMCRAKVEHGSQAIREDIILKLYEKRIEEMRDAGLDISRTEILFSRFLEDDYKQNPSWDSLFKNIKRTSQVKEGGDE